MPLTEEQIREIAERMDNVFASTEKREAIEHGIREALALAEKGESEHVAHCCYQHHEDGHITIDTCDSDTKGAFKVYRHPLWPQMPGDSEITNYLDDALSGCVCSYCESDRNRVWKFVEWARTNYPKSDEEIEAVAYTQGFMDCERLLAKKGIEDRNWNGDLSITKHMYEKWLRSRVPQGVRTEGEGK